METIYLVRQKGVYWKDVLGISTSEIEAIDKCKAMALLDSDSYHLWIVSKHKNGEFTSVDSKGEIQEPCRSEEIIFRTDRDTEMKNTSSL